MVIRIRLPESAILVPHALPLNPPNTSEWTTPSRAQASMTTGSSATIGMCSVTRSPALTPPKSRSSAANSLTRWWRSRYVIATGSSDSGSGTQMMAALLALAARCRSTQLYDALSLPPTNQFQNGALLVSRIVSHGASQLSMSEYSLKQSGKFSSLNRSKIAGSAALACWTNDSGG